MKRRIANVLLASTLSLSLMAGNAAAFAQTVLADEDTEEVEVELEDDDEEEEDLIVTLLTFTPLTPEMTDPVEKRLNEITREKINANVDFEWKDAGAYLSSVPVMLQASEQIDLVMFTPIPAASFQSFMSQGQLMDITDILPACAPDVAEIMGEYLKATSRNGRVYGVGNLLCLASTLSIDMRKDVLEKAGVLEQAQGMTTWQDVKEVMKAAVDTAGINGFVSLDDLGDVLTMAPFVIGKDDLTGAEWLDSCGDTYYFTYVDPADDKVKCYFENEKWADGIKLAREFFNEGLIYKDAATAQETGVTLIRSEVGLAQVSPKELEPEVQFFSSTGFEDVNTPLATCKVSTASFQKFGYAVPVTSGNPERALKLLNLMWTDKEFMDTLAWGIQGEDWVLNEDGMADYPEGKDNNSVYHLQDFMIGNCLEVTPWIGEDKDIRQHAYEANANLDISKYLGFSIDSTAVADQVVACKYVFDQYAPTLNSGAAGDNVDELIADFVEKLYGAGMQDIIDEYQRQLDEFLAEQ